MAEALSPDLAVEPVKYETRVAGEWTRLAILFSVIAAYCLYSWDVKRRQPDPEFINWSFVSSDTPTNEGRTVCALVRNNGSLGAITLYATLSTDDGVWTNVETVSLPTLAVEKFWFEFPSATGGNAGCSFRYPGALVNVQPKGVSSGPLPSPAALRRAAVNAGAKSR